MSQRQSLYLGRAGQMAVMAEFLWRGWKVALPEVDVGEDVFIVKDETGELSRVQVKTATAKPLQSGYFAQFNVSLNQQPGFPGLSERLVEMAGPRALKFGYHLGA